MSDTHIVIMAGGVGSRLFPVSTPEHPKQFLDLLNCGETLIQSTCKRFREVDPEAKLWVVTSEKYLDFIHTQLPQIPDEQILLEPASRNTAPCIAYACRKISKKYPDANIIVTPSDAYVPDYGSFARTVNEALAFTRHNDSIICVGIRPQWPETGYGYIKAGGAVSGMIKKIDAFKEKPTLELAREYLEAGDYLWNAGIFISRADVLLGEIRKFTPGIAILVDAMSDSFYTDTEQETLRRLFPQCEKISIDYAVMEKSLIGHVIESSWVWSDLGSFEAIEKIIGKK